MTLSAQENSSRLRWQHHYGRSRSLLSYPDENLVRFVVPALQQNLIGYNATVLDIGCGSGRHLQFLYEQNIIPLGLDIVNLEKIKARFGNPGPGLIQATAARLPFRTNSLEAALAWGSLHYNSKELTRQMIAEIVRILKPHGLFWGTLRGEADTFFRRMRQTAPGEWEVATPDLETITVSFYSLEEVEALLAGFESFRVGLMQRTLPGQPDKNIAHFYFEAIR